MSEKCKQQPKQCNITATDRRDSICRFDDKVSHKLLQYLSISDCFRFECVCKQWQTVLYNTQHKLIVSEDKHYNECRERFDVSLMFDLEVYKTAKETNKYWDQYNINNQVLQRVLKKCATIHHITIAYIDDYVLDVISNNCTNLVTLKVLNEYNEVSAKCWKKFGEKCGLTLERIDVGWITVEEMKILMPLLTNIRSIDKWDTESFFYLMFECFGGECVPKLEEIHSEVIVNKYFVHFTEIYCTQMKKMTIRLTNNGGDAQSSFKTYQQIGNFTELESLRCNCGYIKETQFRAIIKLIKKNCLKLRSFSLIDVTFRYVFFNFRDGFAALRKLRLNGEKCGSFEYLKDCVSLTHLSLHQRSFDRKRVRDIHMNVPKLTNFELSSERRITSDIFLYLTRLRRLSEIKIVCYSAKKSRVKNKHVIEFIRVCHSIRTIWFECHTTLDKDKLDQYLTKKGRKIFISFYN